MSAAVLVEHTRNIFADYGTPGCVVSDNGRQLTSNEFRSFLSKNGVKYLNTPPFHPSSNGLVERAVRSFKQHLKKISEADITARLARVLFAMRTAVCSYTNQSPMNLFYANLQVRTPFRVIKPSREVPQSEETPISRRQFNVGDAIRFRDYRKGKSQWSLGSIVERLGSRLYTVQDKSKVFHVRSIDQLIESTVEPATLSFNLAHEDFCYSDAYVDDPLENQGRHFELAEGVEARQQNQAYVELNPREQLGNFTEAVRFQEAPRTQEAEQILAANIQK